MKTYILQAAAPTQADSLCMFGILSPVRIKISLRGTTMKITVLVENTAGNKGLKTEHGLSLYIEALGKKILFDMGQTSLFNENAQTLGIDLSSVDIAVVSHGHYDHGGGLSLFLSHGINTTSKVYINKHAFEPHFNGTEKYIGLDDALSKSERIVYTDTEFSICKGIKLYPAADNITGIFSSTGLTYKKNGNHYPEDFRHEQYLMIEENGKKVLFSGCSHRGITNIEKQFCPDVLIGGFHLSKLSCCDSELSSYAEFLNRFPTEYYTCHCTGTEQFEYLSKRMKSLHYLHCGDQIII